MIFRRLAGGNFAAKEGVFFAEKGVGMTRLRNSYYRGHLRLYYVHNLLYVILLDTLCAFRYKPLR
jgi:hypothetical protein